MPTPQKVTIRTYLFEQATAELNVTEEKWLMKVMKYVNAHAKGHDENVEKTRATWAGELGESTENQATKA